MEAVVLSVGADSDLALCWDGVGWWSARIQQRGGQVVVVGKDPAVRWLTRILLRAIREGPGRQPPRVGATPGIWGILK